MAITNATIKHFNTRSNYDNISQRGGISQGDLVFIKDKQQIITHGQVYDCGNYEANLKWGGKNFVESYGPIDAAMVPELGANRFAFLNPAGITLEYSKDGGNTWTEETDPAMKMIFSEGNSFCIGQRGGGKNATKDWMCRVTINTKLANIYTELYKLVIYCTTSGSQGCYGKLEASTNGNPTEFKTIVNKFYLNGWSGYNVINDFYITTYGNTTSQYQYLRLTFGIEKPSTEYNNLSILKILAFGGVGWNTPSNMAKTGHLYYYDGYQNATFPAAVIANNFYGNLDWSYIQNKPSSYDTAWIEYE